MSRRVEVLSAAEAAALIGDLPSDSDSESDTEAVQQPDSEEEQDVLHRYVPDEVGADGEPEDEPDVGRRELTRSQKKLAEADFRPQEPAAAGPYVARGARQAIVAEWLTEPPPLNRRRDPANVLTERAGVRGDARNVSTETDAFKLFITDEVIGEIRQNTNKKLDLAKEKIKASSSAKTQEKSLHLYQHISHNEMTAFLGLSVIRAFYKNLTVPQLFDPATGPSLFKAVMGGRRYAVILQNLTFDNRETRDERKKGDKFCHIRDLFNTVDSNLRRHFVPSECLTVDESLVRFRGRCPFKMYLPSKPGKYGILLRTVADASYRYMWKMWPYSGRPEEPDQSPPHVQLPSVMDMVKYLVEDVAGTGRNVTLDRFFTSVPLAEDLMASRLTMVGTVNRGRKLLPEEMKKTSGREPGTTLFGFRNGVTLVSHAPKPNKVVLLMSTQHHAPMVDAHSGKPEIMLFYNSTKGGVDVLDAMVEKCMGKPPLNRWPTAVLFFLLGVAQVNSTTILLLNRGHGTSEVSNGVRREMAFSLARGLVMPHIQDRVANPTGLNSDITMAISYVTGTSQSQIQQRRVTQAVTRGRCVACLGELKGSAGFRQQKDKMPKEPPCEKCQNYVCKRHGKTIRVCDPDCNVSD